MKFQWLMISCVAFFFSLSHVGQAHAKKCLGKHSDGSKMFWDATYKQCLATTQGCPSGYRYHKPLGKCYVGTQPKKVPCGSGLYYDKTYDQCLHLIRPPSGYKYSPRLNAFYKISPKKPKHCSEGVWSSSSKQCLSLRSRCRKKGYQWSDRLARCYLKLW